MPSKELTPASINGAASPVRIAGTAAHAEQAAIFEQAYEQWKLNPKGVDASWSAFFEGFELGLQAAPKTSARAQASAEVSSLGAADESGSVGKQASVYTLIFAYRMLGHEQAKLDPLGIAQTQSPELELSHFGLGDEDLETVFDLGSLAGGGRRTLREILEVLNRTYCSSMGVEYMHIQDTKMRRWVRDRLEISHNRPHFNASQKKRVLTQLFHAEEFERFLHTRYVGQKRFSLEGGETLIPMLDWLVESCPDFGVQQVVLGMAHRGRLNVLANIFGKSYHDIFSEFADNYIPQSVQGDGDVKYHMGFEGSRATASGRKVGLAMAPNPSHLEAVGPVVEGKARAQQRILGDTETRASVLPILIHGDAAFIGQGVVAEMLNFSQLPGYRTGGTIHIIVNNQIGFTTMPEEGRSTRYCTAPGKVLEIPIFHVNGDDPLAAVHAIQMALVFRQHFHRDIIIDLVCYRRLGHNEGDEPSFTSPTLYAAIEKHPPTSELLLQELLQTNVISEAEAAQYKTELEAHLSQALADAKATSKDFVPAIRDSLACHELLAPVETKVTAEVLARVGQALTQTPTSLRINDKLTRWVQGRREMLAGKQPVDWGLAESLAFGTVLEQGIPVRISGQDSCRGTFSHRHAVLFDTQTGEPFTPLSNLSKQQAPFSIYNSPLSEGSVLGFDFGYSLDYPQMLICWEAQFGDFGNGAQIMIDQYIASSESKWGVASGIVLLLPHGYHGQGPEHSSARLERFLELSAEDNWQVIYPTTPANYFHALRRQVVRSLRKPLIVMTPKGLLRDKRCSSPLEDFTAGAFNEVLPDMGAQDAAKVRRVILCSGKVYYDLEDYRQKQKTADTAILRLEQLYPLHEAKLKEALAPFSKVDTFVWCQEESANMGAWRYIEPQLRALNGRDWRYAGRDASASPATGALAIHTLEQAALVQEAFTIA